MNRLKFKTPDMEEVESEKRNSYEKIFSIILICLLMFVFTGCKGRNVGEFTPTENEVTTNSARFRELGRETVSSVSNKNCLEDAYYYVDTYTNVVYVYFIDWDANATRGMMTVLYNVDGTPMTLEEFMS